MRKGTHKSKAKADGLDDEELLARTQTEEVRLLEGHYSLCRRSCHASEDRPRKTVRVNPRAVIINDNLAREVDRRNEPRKSILKTSAAMDEQQRPIPKLTKEDTQAVARRLRSVYLKDACTQMTPPNSLMTVGTEVSNYPADDSRTRFSGEDDETTAADIETLTCESTRLRFSPTRRAAWLCPPSSSSSASTVPMSSVTVSNVRPKTSSESDSNTKQKTKGFGPDASSDKPLKPVPGLSKLNAVISPGLRSQPPAMSATSNPFHPSNAATSYGQLLSSTAAAVAHRTAHQHFHSELLQPPSSRQDALEALLRNNWTMLSQSQTPGNKPLGLPNASATNEVATNAQGDFSQSVSENTSKDISNLSSKSSKTLDWGASEISSRKSKLETPLLGEGQQWTNSRLNCCGNSSSFLVAKRKKSKLTVHDVEKEEVKKQPTAEELMNAIISAQRATDIFGRMGIDFASCFDRNVLQNLSGTLNDDEKLVKLLTDIKLPTDKPADLAGMTQDAQDNSCSSKHSAAKPWRLSQEHSPMTSQERNATSVDSLHTLFQAQEQRDNSPCLSQKPTHQSNQSRSVDPTNLYFANLPKNVRDCDLVRLVEEFGPVISAKLMENPALKVKGVGFVRMRFQQDCERVIKAYNGKNFPGTKKILSVKLAWKSKDTDNASVSSLYTPADYTPQQYKPYFNPQVYPGNGSADPRHVAPWTQSEVYQHHGVQRSYNPYYGNGVANPTGLWIPNKDQSEYMPWAGTPYVPGYPQVPPNIEYAVVPGADAGDSSWGLWGMESGYQHDPQTFSYPPSVNPGIGRDQGMEFDPNNVYQGHSGFPAGFTPQGYYPMTTPAGYPGVKPPNSATNFSTSNGNQFYQPSMIPRPFVYANGNYNARPVDGYFRQRDRDDLQRDSLPNKQDNTENCETLANDVTDHHCDNSVDSSTPRGGDSTDEKNKLGALYAGDEGKLGGQYGDGGHNVRSPHTISMKKPGAHSQCMDSTWRSSGDGPRRQTSGADKANNEVNDCGMKRISACGQAKCQGQSSFSSSTPNCSGDMCNSTTTTAPDSDSSKRHDSAAILQDVSHYMPSSDDKAQGDVLRSSGKASHHHHHHRRDGSDGGAAAGAMAAV